MSIHSFRLLSASRLRPWSSVSNERSDTLSLFCGPASEITLYLGSHSLCGHLSPSLLFPGIWTHALKSNNIDCHDIYLHETNDSTRMAKLKRVGEKGLYYSCEMLGKDFIDHSSQRYGT